MPPKVLVLCPTSREYSDLPALAAALGCEIVFDELCGDYFDLFLGKHPPCPAPALDIVRSIEEAVERYRNVGLHGITSGVGYPGMSVASVVASRLGLPGPAPASVMGCEHKYYSRLAQRRLVPEAVPEFHLLRPAHGEGDVQGVRFPAFMKPVKSCMSINARRVDDAAQLRERARTAVLPAGFIRPFEEMLWAYTDYTLDAGYLLVESLLEGWQVSLEGYVSRGAAHVMGILDAVMFPGTISFKRFRYPSRLPDSVQRRMCDIAATLMPGLGYDNAPFNIELIYDPRADRIGIVEVNPKLASQFTDLFLKVDGRSAYAVLLELALGREPKFVRGCGRYRVAASCVLRTFEDRYVVAVPSRSEIDAIVEEYPDARIEVHATPGRNLSDQMQDAQSFRYGLVGIGADSERELEDKLAAIAGRLHFTFAAARDTASSHSSSMPLARA